ncbi:MAG: SDR family oxidoreductase [Sphingobacteriales bacterium]|nr:SDR family oxidoreductase [Sphingobacteriales bacterium]OJY92497.1 MAG: 2-deoxy-D-gluconate 3-dehydrogenase [Sphingobacteriales bacterium 44-15]
MSNLFKDKLVLISGGLGDIGRAITLALAREGAVVALCDVHGEEEALPLLEQLERTGAAAYYSMVDVTNPDAVNSWIGSITEKVSAPSIVIPNAATVTQADCSHITPAQWSKEIEVNLNGAFYVAQSGVLQMVKNNKQGHIVFIGSWAAHAVHAQIPAYSVAKAGLRMLCKCMALQFAAHGILVNEIAPGFVEAGLSKKIWESHPALQQQAKEKVPVKKLITPEEIAWQVIQLCHPNNKNITGSTVLLDGGLSLLT